MDSSRTRSWKSVLAWLGLLGVAVGLRAWHLTGFVVSNDEGHWLLYALDKQLLFEPLKNSYPRPDLLFPLLVSATAKLFGSNELALRLWPMVAGALSIFPLAALISRITGDRRAGWVGAAFLAVLPLHVYFSATGIPDTMALFLGLCALVFMMRARQSRAAADFAGMSVFMAVALLTKATAIYGWAFMAVGGAFLFAERKSRQAFYGSLALSAAPLLIVTLAICWRSRALSFFHEPGVTEKFGFETAMLRLELQYLAAFYEALLVAAAIGVALVIRRVVRGVVADGLLLVWLLPLVSLLVTPIFRAGRVEMLWLIPSVCLFAVLAVRSLPRIWAQCSAGVVLVLLATGSLYGVPVPYPGRAKAASDYTTAVLDRPSGWPSRDAARWLTAHTEADDTILFTAYTFTDPLLLKLSEVRRVIPNAGENWELLRDPTNQVHYAVFTQDYRAYVPTFARYADTHFELLKDAQFPGYGIYDCQKNGRFVAYPDAYNSAARYARAGVEYMQQHQLGAAVTAFETALKVNPNEPASSVILALVYSELGRDADAIAQCEQNIHSGVEPSTSYGVLGQIRERQGDLAAARAAYEESLALDPHNPTTTRLLADLKARLASTNAPAK
ncbi:MAG TPA: glycosyltransferase family 39 protein [Verrucomicrobiae bacterium]|nr:glycosyltransferase family 39 protein [Verrucomicrobiae bacterium]